MVGLPGALKLVELCARAQLAMHSIREMCGVDDVSHAYHHFRAFFEDFSALDASVDCADDLPAPAIEGTLTDVPCNRLH